MPAEERERMNWLCQRIQDEQNQHKISELVIELTALLEKNEAPSQSRDDESEWRTSLPAFPL